MPESRTVAGQSSGSEEERILSGLRPQSLSEFTGQKIQCLRLQIALQAARQRGEALDHLLLSGPPGLGKTSLAHIVANEMGGQLVTTSGPTLAKIQDLMGILTKLKPGAVLFIDEIHRMPRMIEEYLYPAMEDCAVDQILDKSDSASTPTQIQINPFTLVGATTRKGLLSAPLRERFGLDFTLDFYNVADLCSIIQRSARLLDVDLTQDGAQEIARRSRGTPRIANRLLRRCRDFAEVRYCAADRTMVCSALELEGVDQAGLDELDRRYLHVLIERYKGKPAGVKALAAAMQQEQDTLEEVVEPYLLYEGFLLRTPTGRQAAPRAYEHLGLAA